MSDRIRLINLALASRARAFESLLEYRLHLANAEALEKVFCEATDEEIAASLRAIDEATKPEGDPPCGTGSSN